MAALINQNVILKLLPIWLQYYNNSTSVQVFDICLQQKCKDTVDRPLMTLIQSHLEKAGFPEFTEEIYHVWKDDGKETLMAESTLKIPFHTQCIHQQSIVIEHKKCHLNFQVKELLPSSSSSSSSSDTPPPPYIQYRHIYANVLQSSNVDGLGLRCEMRANFTTGAPCKWVNAINYEIHFFFTRSSRPDVTNTTTIVCQDEIAIVLESLSAILDLPSSATNKKIGCEINQNVWQNIFLDELIPMVHTYEDMLIKDEITNKTKTKNKTHEENHVKFCVKLPFIHPQINSLLKYHKWMEEDNNNNSNNLSDDEKQGHILSSVKVMVQPNQPPLEFLLYTFPKQQPPQQKTARDNDVRLFIYPNKIFQLWIFPFSSLIYIEVLPHIFDCMDVTHIMVNLFERAFECTGKEHFFLIHLVGQNKNNIVKKRKRTYRKKTKTKPN